MVLPERTRLLDPRKNEPVQRRALKNTFVGGVSLVVGSALSFISVPICLRAWGSDRYGAWLALIAGATFVRTIDAGYTSYVGNQLNVLYHDDQTRMRRSLAASLRIGLCLGAAEILIWMFATATGRIHSILGVGVLDVERYHLAAAFGVVVVVSAVTAPYLGILHRLFIPVGMMYEASWFAIANQLALILGLIAAVLLGASILQAAIVYACLQTLNYIASAWYLRRQAPELTPWWNIRGFRTGIRDFFHSTVLTLNGVGQQATTSGTVVFVSSLFGASGVPLFTTVRTLANVWTTLSSVFASPLLPEVVRYHGTKEHEKLFKAFRAHWFFSGMIVNFSMILLCPFVERFYAIWTRRTLQFDSGLFFCMIASISLSNFGSILNVYLSGINSLAAQLACTAARAIALFGLAFALVPSLGLRGLGVAVLFSEVASSVILTVYFTNRELQRFKTRLPWRDIALALLGTMPLEVIAVQSILRPIDPASWIIAAAAMTLIGWFNWKWLDPDVKSRALLIFRS